MRHSYHHPLWLWSIFILLWSLATTAHAQLTPDEDFAARCAAAGVIRCYPFDNETTDMVRGVSLGPDAYGVYRAGLDPDIKTSGAGSLRFVLPPPPHAGANIAGQWTGTYLNPVLVQTFGQNSTFYVQYRVRWSPEMMTNTWASSWKISIIHSTIQSCGPIEWTIGRYYATAMIAPNTHCGGKGPLTDTVTGLWQDPKIRVEPYYNLQQGDYICKYTWAGDPNRCFFAHPNEWTTFYHEFHIGTWGVRNSQVKMYIQREGDSGYKKIIDVPDYAFDCATAPCNVAPGIYQGFNTVKFTPFMTGLPTTSGLPGVTSYVWYDELIVSTQPIAAPAARPASAGPLIPRKRVGGGGGTGGGRTQ